MGGCFLFPLKNVYYRRRIPAKTMLKEESTIRPVKAQKTIAGHRYFALFLFLLTYLIFYSYAESSAAGYAVFRILALAITVLSVYAVSFRRSIAVIAIALAFPALLHRVSILSQDASLLSILNMSLTFAFDAFIVTIIFHRVFIRGKHDSEAVFGALSIYLLMGFGFANLYGLLEKLQVHAFYLDPVVNLHATPNHIDFIYYSFATMTSLGAAGITVVSEQARSLSIIQSILGLLYLAVLISRLMGAYSKAACE
jgi:Ion channel